MLIHATVTISGDEVLLPVCEPRVARLLAAENIDGEIARHHGPGALSYDFKLSSGIPVPVFARLSTEFPTLRFELEWVNPDAAERGRAAIVEGKLVEHESGQLAMTSSAGPPVHVAVGADGGLTLAFALLRATPPEWIGYALTADRDALLRAIRQSGSDEAELWATEGDAEWRLHWRGNLATGVFEIVPASPPLTIEEAEFILLEQAAQAFATDWVWFADAPEADIAIERERCVRAERVLHAANLRSERLHRIAGGNALPGKNIEYSTLAPESAWIKDLISACWMSRAPMPERQR